MGSGAIAGAAGLAGAGACVCVGHRRHRHCRLLVRSPLACLPPPCLLRLSCAHAHFPAAPACLNAARCAPPPCCPPHFAGRLRTRRARPRPTDQALRLAADPPSGPAQPAMIEEIDSVEFTRHYLEKVRQAAGCCGRRSTCSVAAASRAALGRRRHVGSTARHELSHFHPPSTLDSTQRAGLPRAGVRPESFPGRRPRLCAAGGRLPLPPRRRRRHGAARGAARAPWQRDRRSSSRAHAGPRPGRSQGGPCRSPCSSSGGRAADGGRGGGSRGGRLDAE